MRDIFLERVGNNEEEQIQDSRTHPDILRNILCGAYTVTWYSRTPPQRCADHKGNCGTNLFRPDAGVERDQGNLQYQMLYSRKHNFLWNCEVCLQNNKSPCVYLAVAKRKHGWYNDENELMFGSISYKPDIYCNVGSSCDREGYLWIIRKRLSGW